MATKARERLLAAAEMLFYADGIRATGIERVLQESGVGRASFYRHFSSKDDLVVEVLHGRDARWRAWLEQAVDARVLPARNRPLAVFDALAERFARNDFRGCAFINTMVETADSAGVAFQAAAEHKRRVTDYLDHLLSDAGYPDHAALAEQLQLLVDGAIVTALREGSPDAAHRARSIAAAVLAAHPSGKS
ncbi:TetR/AcrR family transcriptional regulator [Streptomyces sp. H34-S4]|uniref:TetR/AcrR family transcriptional regulator n=1 Tax=Streptomyces sp. H34-S4 TaxID=2996463 RepID=UPI00226E31F0|nr:TetR/AcrR family transcriptional regulator [Streptomyces sp. H34-S4]MCY0939217.1 helix-turn-helix domain containing protein [Streptomyces sp. H34-S4]